MFTGIIKGYNEDNCPDEYLEGPCFTVDNKNTLTFQNASFRCKVVRDGQRQLSARLIIGDMLLPEDEGKVIAYMKQCGQLLTDMRAKADELKNTWHGTQLIEI